MDGLLTPDDMMSYGTDAPVDPNMAMAVPEMGLLMLPSSGVSEMLGLAPDPFGEGNLPSTMDLIRAGDYEGLGYQAIGVAGDALYAISPFTGGLLVLPATAAKGIRAKNIIEQASKFETVPVGTKYTPNPSKKEKFTVGEKVDATPASSELSKSAEMEDVKSVPLSAFDVETTPASKRLEKKLQKSKTIDPVTVIHDDTGFKLVDGEKRVAAMRDIGMRNIPAKIVVDLDNPPFAHTATPLVNIAKGSEAEKILQQDALKHGRQAAAGEVPMQDFGKQTKNDLPYSEYEFETTKTMDLDDSLLFDPQDYVGRTMKMLPSDITGAGYQIDSILGQRLTNPTQMMGGFEFSLDPRHIYGWASEPGVISGIANEANKYEEGLLGVVSAMGGRSNDFSHHITDPMIDIARQNAPNVDPAVIAQYDANIQKFMGDEDVFPGLLSDDLISRLYAMDDTRISGGIRKEMAKEMDKATYRNAGLVPSMGAIRYAATHPRFRTALEDITAYMNPTGQRVIDIPQNPRVAHNRDLNLQPHKTYLSNIEGYNLGTNITPIPRRLYFPDAALMRAMINANPSYDRRAAEVANITNLLTQKIADDVSNYDYYYQKGLLGQ